MAITDDSIKKKIENWVLNPYNKELKEEVEKLIENKEEDTLYDCFFKDLEFGTGGMRGVMQAGLNRMNAYTVAKATQGLANYLKIIGKDNQSVAVAFDTRNNSAYFARVSAEVLAANNIKVLLAPKPMPTPFLSFAVRQTLSAAGILITASHNPPEYNGYKVFFEDGAQILPPHDKNIIAEVNKIESVSHIQNFNSSKESYIQSISKNLENDYLDAVKNCIDLNQFSKASKLKVVYTPLHGTGKELMSNLLEKHLKVDFNLLEEQASFDGNFPTVKSPNPEETEALSMAISKAKELNADLVFGTDPDADRLGVVAKHKSDYILLNGNEVGTIAMHYLLSTRKLKNPYICSTIVSSDIILPICKKFSANADITLTGFKYIGESITKNEGNPNLNFLFGYEESYGFLIGNYIRDKDGISAAALLCEIALFLQKQDKTLIDYLDDIYKEYGFYKESLRSFTLKGERGSLEIEKIMRFLRLRSQDNLFSYPILKKQDYLEQWEYNPNRGKQKMDQLPISNVLVFYLAPHYKIAIRPSGTEPKIKFYFALNSIKEDISKIELKNKLQNFENTIISEIEKIIKS